LTIELDYTKILASFLERINDQNIPYLRIRLSTKHNICMKLRKLLTLLFIFSLFVFSSSCSDTVGRMVINSMANSLGNSNGQSSYALTGEEDPELMGEAFPFMLKMLEIMLESSPDNIDLRLSTVQGFTMYSNQWLAFKAKTLEEDHYDQSVHLSTRSKLLYRRAQKYGLIGLNEIFPNFEQRLIKDQKNLLLEIDEETVPLVTWTSFSWLAYILGSSDKPQLYAKIPSIIALLKRTLEINDSFDSGILHEFFVGYYGNQTKGNDQFFANAQRHFKKAVEITKGKKCSPYLAWATSVAVKIQNKKLFKEMLTKALEIDSNQNPSFRLANKLCQQQAKWYQKQIEDLFL
jgi:hypothetical protein